MTGRSIAVREPRIDGELRYAGQGMLWLGGALLVAALAFLPLTWLALLAGGAGAALLLVRWPWLIWLPLAVLVPFASAQRIG
ncbi:MAG: hypothetical protein KDE01_03375, partial [Caldilineaceae bacterium]|nr:hypothetical protein [Caldilineaceae bacterium]